MHLLHLLSLENQNYNTYMQHPEIKFIVRYPNGHLQLATQPKVKDLKLVKCSNCKKMHTLREKMKIRCT